VNRGIPTESARNGEIPKIQTPLFGTMRHAALSDLFVQTFLNSPFFVGDVYRFDNRCLRVYE
ncbi:hypothetical protein EI541_22720, partial [Xanthomonas citri pv. eucalyptorum]